MKKVVFVGGLPGSGKTEYINKNFSGCTIIDDIRNKEQLPESFDDILIVADPYFAIRKHLEKAISFVKEKYGDIQVEIIVFENDPDNCCKNVIKRNDGRFVMPTIRILTKNYDCHPDAIILPVWKNND